MADVFYFDQSYRQLAENIDSLLPTKIGRKELFLLAMALGLDNPTKIKGKRDSMVRYSYFKPNEISLIYTCAWRYYKDIQALMDQNKVYTLAENCANTGFSIIANYVKENQHKFINRILLDTITKFPPPTDDDEPEEDENT